MNMGDLYERFNQDLQRYARAVARNREEAEDLVQETFLRALDNAGLLETLALAQRRSWLFRVLKNCLIDRRRQGRREYLDNVEISCNGMDHMDDRILVQELLAELPLQMHRLIFRRYWLEENSTEIGKNLSLSPSTVRYQISKAIRLMQEKA